MKLDFLAYPEPSKAMTCRRGPCGGAPVTGRIARTDVARFVLTCSDERCIALGVELLEAENPRSPETEAERAALEAKNDAEWLKALGANTHIPHPARNDAGEGGDGPGR